MAAGTHYESPKIAWNAEIVPHTAWKEGVLRDEMYYYRWVFASRVMSCRIRFKNYHNVVGALQSATQRNRKEEAKIMKQYDDCILKINTTISI